MYINGGFFYNGRADRIFRWGSDPYLYPTETLDQLARVVFPTCIRTFNRMTTGKALDVLGKSIALRRTSRSDEHGNHADAAREDRGDFQPHVVVGIVDAAVPCFIARESIHCRPISTSMTSMREASFGFPHQSQPRE